MCRRTSLDLPASPVSASQARSFLSATVARWGLPELRDDLMLAVSEVVTNAVLHARTPMSVHAAVTGGIVEVGVSDTDPRPPVVRAPREDLVGDLDMMRGFDDTDPRDPTMSVGDAGSVAAGRGLHLLEAVADQWGVTQTRDEVGKEVWFSVALPAGWPYAELCSCEDQPPTQLTAGGRPVRHTPGPWDG